MPGAQKSLQGLTFPTVNHLPWEPPVNTPPGQLYREGRRGQGGGGVQGMWAQMGPGSHCGSWSPEQGESPEQGLGGRSEGCGGRWAKAGGSLKQGRVAGAGRGGQSWRGKPRAGEESREGVGPEQGEGRRMGEEEGGAGVRKVGSLEQRRVPGAGGGVQSRRGPEQGVGKGSPEQWARERGAGAGHGVQQLKTCELMAWGAQEAAGTGPRPPTPRAPLLSVGSFASTQRLNSLHPGGKVTFLAPKGAEGGHTHGHL